MENLSNQEIKVIQEIVRGRNNSEISEIMHISIHTVKAHISSILRKLNAKNRANAVYIAYKNNICE